MQCRGAGFGGRTLNKEKILRTALCAQTFSLDNNWINMEAVFPEFPKVQLLGPQSPRGVGNSNKYFSRGVCALPEIHEGEAFPKPPSYIGLQPPSNCLGDPGINSGLIE